MNVLDTIEWTDYESVLAQMSSLFNEIFAGSCYSTARNSTIGEKDVDIFAHGNSRRVGSIWPKLRYHYFDIMLRVEVVDRLRLKIVLPPIKEDKKGKLPGFRTFKAVSIDKTEEILCAVAGLD